jgi:alpha-D-ribose 1-methylphosphonate 5-triphosphate synthase subunit PhnI
MNSGIFSAMGLASLDPAILFIVMLVLLIVAFVLIIIQNKKLSTLQKKYASFMQGKEAESLEDEIVGLFHDNRLIRSENDKNRKDIIDINRRVIRSFQKFGLEKYDAFSTNGGKLSFALCMLDEDDNGFLLNSVHNSDGMNYSYAKEIKAGVSDVELSKDERRALDKALESANRR